MQIAKIPLCVYTRALKGTHEQKVKISSIERFSKILWAKRRDIFSTSLRTPHSHTTLQSQSKNERIVSNTCISSRKDQHENIKNIISTSWKSQNNIHSRGWGEAVEKISWEISGQPSKSRAQEDGRLLSADRKTISNVHIQYQCDWKGLLSSPRTPKKSK